MRDTWAQTGCVSSAGDTRETPAIDVCKGLLEEGAKLRIFDPQVTFDQIKQDLSLAPFEWDRPGNTIPKQCVCPPPLLFLPAHVRCPGST